MPAWLTTAIAGAIGTAVATYFQDRSWHHQQRERKKESENKLATEVFEQLSRAMDQRIYTMRQVHWYITEEYSEADIEGIWEEYRQILFQWNGNLNRTLSMVERYFGHKNTGLLEKELQPRFRELHILLRGYYHHADEREDFDHKAYRDLADEISEEIRILNLNMIGHLQKGTVGVFNPDVPDSGS